LAPGKDKKVDQLDFHRFLRELIKFFVEVMFVVIYVFECRDAEPKYGLRKLHLHYRILKHILVVLLIPIHYAPICLSCELLLLLDLSL
jgi:hypothetical protein